MIDFSCSFCGKALQVSDQHAGKPARCPGCGQIVTVPEPAKAQPAERIEEHPKAETAVPYKTPPKPAKKAEEAAASAMGEEYMPSPDDPPDEECRHFVTLKMVCGIGGIIAALFCIAAGGWASGVRGGMGAGAILLGLVGAFFCVAFAAIGWVVFSYLAKIAVYLYSIDKRLKGK
jgi:DNA-directed RNA polymerase subunit RPC12/RpoP